MCVAIVRQDLLTDVVLYKPQRPEEMQGRLGAVKNLARTTHFPEAV